MLQFDYSNAAFLGARHSDSTRNIKPHSHQYYELNFLTRGTTKMRINEQVIEYNSYDFLIIPPRTNHLLHESEYVTFDNYVIWFECDDVLVADNFVIKLHDYEGAVQFLCSEIYRLYVASGKEQEDLLNLYLKAVLYHMQNGIVLEASQHTRENGGWIDDAARLINESLYKESFTVESISRRFGVTPEHFSREFKKKIGTPPVKYINELKINEAKRLLLCESYTVKEIALRLHYADQFYFSRQFRQFNGCSPREYRSRHRAPFVT